MRCALLVLALWSVGCGSPLRASLDAWHPSGRVAPLDEGQRALLARMVTDTPTDDALTARERIDELPSIGDAEVRALLESSLAWLERVRDSEIERLGSQACEANTVFVPRRDEDGGRVETRDVIGDLSSQDGEWVSSGVPIPVLARGTHMGLAETWNLHELRDAECARASRAVRPGEHAFATEIHWGGLVFLVFVAERGGQWRVVDVVYSGQVEVTGYTRG